MKSPFKFLDAYTANDRDIFYGRDKEVDELYDLVFKSPLVLVYGLSGTGKTSLVQCGLSSKFDGPEWNPYLIRRGNNINAAINQAFASSLMGPSKGSLAKDVEYLYDTYFRPVYLMFDQFEELFILGSVDERNKFIVEITELMKQNLPCKILLIMREEYLGQLYPFEREIPTLLDFRFRVEPMGVNKVSGVIAKSFAKFNIDIEEPEGENVALMVQNLNDPKSGIALPYLQVYMDNLYKLVYRKKHGYDTVDEKYPSLTISREDIIENGEIKDVLEKFLEQQEKSLTKELKKKHENLKQDTLQRLLDGFVTEDGTKRPMAYDREDGHITINENVKKFLPLLPPELLDDCIDALEASRLLRVSDDSIELAHDSLAALIDQRRSDEQRELNKIRKRLLNSYDEYRSSGAPLTARQLRMFDGYLEQLNVDQEVLNYVKFSEGEIQKQEQAKRDMDRKEYELEQEKKRAELIEGKLEAEKRKNVLEKKNKKLLGGLVIASLVALLALGAATFALSNQRDSLAGQNQDLEKANQDLENASQEIMKLNEKMVMQRDTIVKFANDQTKKISRINIQIEDIEEMAKGRRPFNALSASRATLFISGILHNEKMDDIAQRVDNASIYDDNIFMTARTAQQVLASGNLPNRSDVFAVGETARLYAGIRAPRYEELKIEWMKNGEVIQTDNANVEFNTSYTGYRLIKPFSCRETGNYTVRVKNSKDYYIGETNFEVK